MSNLSTPRPPHHAPHPPWCDPRCCETNDTDTVHSTGPTRIREFEAGVELGLRRCDEHRHPDELPEPWVAVRVRNDLMEPPERTEVAFTPAAAGDLGCRLIAMAAMAEQVTP